MHSDVAVVVLAAGSGSRLGDANNKVYLPIGAEPILSYSLKTIVGSQLSSQVVIVIRPQDRRRAETVVARCGAGAIVSLVDGGSTRQESETNGIVALAGDIEAGTVRLVAVHDGARPFVTTDLWEALIAAASEADGAVPGLPLDGVVVEAGQVVDTGSLRRVQTPQVFRAPLLLEAFRAARQGAGGRDTAETVERHMNGRFVLVPGDPRNLKITYPSDLADAEKLASHWSDGSWSDLPD